MKSNILLNIPQNLVATFIPDKKMKKTILLLLLVLFLVPQLFGQVRFGLKAGLNLSNVKNFGLGSTKVKAAANGGFFIKVPIIKKFLLQPEILYSSKGFLFPKTDSTASGKVTLNYISVPILISFKISDNFLLMLGPELNFITNAKSKSANRNNDISNNFRKFDMAIDFGTAYNLKNGLGIEFRYSHGFEDLANVIKTDQLGNYLGTQKQGSNRVMQIGLFYIFPKK